MTRSPAPNEDAVLFENIMKATGLSREEVESLSLMDDELDDLCEATLSDMSSAQKR